MPEETNKHAGNTPVHYPADGSDGVLTPSARLRRQMIKGGTGTVLAVAAAYLGWTKVLFPKGDADEVQPAAPSAPSPSAGPAPTDALHKLGAVSTFAPGAPTLVMLGDPVKQPYLIDNLGGGQFRVLSGLCTHKGCTVGWSPKDNQFVCPCHDGRFSREGKNVSGPPPAPLAPVNVHVENGDLYLA